MRPLKLKKLGSRIINIVRYDGLSILIWKTIAKLLSPLADVSIWVLFDVDLNGPVERKPAKIEVEILEATAADIDRIALFANQIEVLGAEAEAVLSGTGGSLTPSHEREFVIDTFQERFERGEKCFIAKVGSDIAHVNWICFSWGETIPGFNLELFPGEIYTTDGFTPVAYRGLRIHDAVNSEMLAFAKEAGYRRAYTFNSYDRPRARKALFRIGWKETGRLLHIGISGQDYIFRISGNIQPLLR